MTAVRTYPCTWQPQIQEGMINSITVYSNIMANHLAIKEQKYIYASSLISQMDKLMSLSVANV